MKKYLPYPCKAIKIFCFLLFAFCNEMHGFAQGYYKADKFEIGLNVLLTKVPDLAVCDKTGIVMGLREYITANRKFSDKPVLIIFWAIINPPIDEINAVNEGHVADQYNVVLVNLITGAKGTGLSQDLNKALNKADPDNKWRKFLSVGTSWDVAAEQAYLKYAPKFFYADYKLNMICNSDASISEPTIKILAGIGDGQIKKEKLWHDKQGHIVAQDDAEADSWTSYQLTDDLITYKLGKKSKQLGYFQYKKIGPDYVYHGIVNYENSAGQKILSGQFKDGVPVTTLTKFDKNGQLLLTSPVNGTLKVFTSTGKLSLEGKTVNGLGEGVFTVYDNGKITMLYNFKHGEQYGLQQIFKNDSLKNEFYELPGYERVGYFNYGLQKVKLNGLYGFINRSGVVIISPMYSYAEDFKYGVTAFVTKGNQHFYIDRTGKKLTDAEAERLLLSTDYGLY